MTLSRGRRLSANDRSLFFVRGEKCLGLFRNDGEHTHKNGKCEDYETPKHQRGVQLALLYAEVQL